MKGHGQGTQQILFAVPRCTLVCSSFSHTWHFLLQREVESGNDPDRFYTKKEHNFLYRLLHRDEGKYVTKVSILPASLCFFFFNTLSHYSFSHQRVCDIVTTFCPRLSMVGITKVQKNTAPP